MASYHDNQDLVRLVSKLKALERTELAQCLAEVVDEMMADSIPHEIIRTLCSENPPATRPDATGCARGVALTRRAGGGLRNVQFDNIRTTIT
jgi:hypothetical protein